MNAALTDRRYACFGIAGKRENVFKAFFLR
jgi:hypothetical protein